MLLADLYELHGKLARSGRIIPAGFKRAAVHFLVNVDGDGRIVDLVDLRGEGGKGAQRIIPASSRTSAGYAHLICDGLDYVAGLPETRERGAQADKRHGLYVARLQDCATAVGEPARSMLSAIVNATRDASDFRSSLVGSGAPIDLSVLEAESGGDEVDKSKTYREQAKWLVDFRVDGQPLLPEINGSPGQHELVAWWSAVRSSEDATPEPGECQITGTRGPLARLFPATKLPGNQPKLVSANFPAALRYGASQSSGSQVGLAAAIASTQALNWLIDEQKDAHRWTFEELVLTWWADDDLEANPLADFLGGGPRDPREVSDAIRRPLWSGSPRLTETTGFHLALLTVNSARVVVLADHRGTLGSAQRQLDGWFDAIEPVQSLDLRARLGLRELAESACGPGKNQAKPRGRVVARLVRHALIGEPLPVSLRDQVVRRCRVGFQLPNGTRRHVSPQQAALLHLVTSSMKGDLLTRTAPELCGRILAVLEETQDRALGTELNRGVIATYGAASSTPQLSFPRLLQRRTAHLTRLRREHPGAAVNLDRKLGLLMSELHDLGGFPAQLSPAGQAEFALGYFHERQARFQPNHQPTTIDAPEDPKP